MEKDIKVLIVGSTPYSNSSQARSLGTYLNDWATKTSLVRQIYTRPVVPTFEFCNSYFQLTDKMILKHPFFKEKRGVIFKNNSAFTTSENVEKIDVTKGRIFDHASRNKTPFIRLIRGIIWGKKRWLNKKLISWLDDFQPDIVFMCFGDDFHLFNISKLIAEHYKIPIITVISDDYYFPLVKSRNIFSIIYRKKYYRKLKELLNSQSNSVAFNSEKIMKQYTKEFDIKTYDLVSISYSKEFSQLSSLPSNLVDKKVISYFGNFEFGRYKSILQLADAIDANTILRVYGTCRDEKIIKHLSNHPNIFYGGYVSYEETIKLAEESDYLLVAESFDESDSINVQYALSTKIADFLASGKPIIAIGNCNCGSIQYLKENNCAFVCTEPTEIKSLLNDMNKTSISVITNNALEVATNNHDLEKNSNKFYELCKKVVYNN